MADHFRNIYANEAAAYDALVSREDYQGNLLRALDDLCALRGKSIVELGAGTGRLTRMLAPYVNHISAFDAAPLMLTQAAQMLTRANWSLTVADNRALPVKIGVADIVLAGWSFGHATGWYPQEWRKHIAQMISESLRIVNSKGMVIIIETMGTGTDIPQAPTTGLAEYYALLEKEYDFTYTFVHTPYNFASLDEAERLTRFFFGDILADRVRRDGLKILPECTGIWWKQI